MTHPTILDGGLSTALEEAGADLGSSLWTARLLRDDPAAIVAAHRAYFAAGAEVATTASYQASVPSLVRAGFDAEEARRLIVASVTLAGEARDQAQAERGTDRVAGHEVGLRVAASVGPYGAVLADGSEYRGRYGLTPAQLRDFHGPRLELLASAGPDLLAVETIPDADEAAVLVPLLDEVGLPAWFSYAVRGDTTAAGQPLADAYAVLAGCTVLVAAGVNCSTPDDVLGAVTASVATTGLPAVAYPNRGGVWNSVTRTWDEVDGLDLDLVESWVDAGARMLGGCCGTAPRDITTLAGRLRQPSRRHS